MVYNFPRYLEAYNVFTMDMNHPHRNPLHDGIINNRENTIHNHRIIHQSFFNYLLTLITKNLIHILISKQLYFTTLTCT